MEPIIKKHGEDLNKVLRKFKKFSRDEILEAKDRRYYTKPSEVRNRQNQAAKHKKKKDKVAAERKRLLKNIQKRRGYYK